MDVASPGMSGIAAVRLCDNKEQLCPREPCALAFLCVELLVPLELTLLQRWVSPKWHFLQRAGGCKLLSNNRGCIKPARPRTIKQELVFASRGVLTGLGSTALGAATPPRVKERSPCPCPSVAPSGNSTYLGLCRGKNLALGVSPEFGFFSGLV